VQALIATAPEFKSTTLRRANVLSPADTEIGLSASGTRFGGPDRRTQSVSCCRSSGVQPPQDIHLYCPL